MRMRNQGLGSWPVRRARMTPDRVAFIADGHTETYRELRDRVHRLAHALRDLGVRRGDRVAYLGPNHPAFAETMFAVGTLGAVILPLNTRLAAPELAYIVADAGADLLVHAPEMSSTVVELRHHHPFRTEISVGERYEALLADAVDDPIDEAVTLDDICMIQYTSGTSGHPKGVMMSHANIAWNCYNLLLDIDVASDEVTLVSAPMFHTAALNQTFLPTFLKGGTAVLMSAFDPQRALDLIAEHRVTWMFGVPAMYLSIAQSAGWAEADLSSVRTLMCGGAPVPEALIRTYHERGLTFLEGYGLTESSPGALFLRAEESPRKIGSAGTPCFFTDVRVVRSDGSDVAPGETGEVIIQGPNVMAGYWQLPDATKDAFYDEGWLRSGDAATVDDEGFVYIVDRLKDMIISGGENIYPAEVEQVLYQHPAVADCAVIGVPDQRWGEVGRAIVAVRPGTSANAEEILDFLSGRLARYKIPKSVVVVEALPHNAAGKLLKGPLREKFGSPDA
jgi:O-succinylbenzoate-CoA ligase